MIVAASCTVASRPTPPQNGQLNNFGMPFLGIPPLDTFCATAIAVTENPSLKPLKGIQEILSAPRSPWQNAFVERLIGSIRRECLDHVVIFNECGLRRILKSYFEYYEKSRTHLGLAKDAPIPRPVQPPSLGRVIALPQVGGLHHRYERRAA